MMTIEMRRCVVDLSDYGKKRNTKAYFHRWGDGVTYQSNDVCFAETKAIIEEIETGEVFLLSPREVTFEPLANKTAAGVF